MVRSRLSPSTFFTFAWGPRSFIAPGPHPRRCCSAQAPRNGSRLSCADALARNENRASRRGRRRCGGRACPARFRERSRSTRFETSSRNSPHRVVAEPRRIDSRGDVGERLGSIWTLRNERRRVRRRRSAQARQSLGDRDAHADARGMPETCRQISPSYTLAVCVTWFGPLLKDQLSKSATRSEVGREATLEARHGSRDSRSKQWGVAKR